MGYLVAILSRGRAPQVVILSGAPPGAESKDPVWRQQKAPPSSTPRTRDRPPGSATEKHRPHPALAEIARYARFFDTAISFDLGFLSFLPITSLNNRAYRAISANRLPILLSTTYHEPMEPTLCHTSALEYWRSVRIGQRSFRAIEDTRPLLDEPPRKGSLAEPGPWWLERPLHVLVPHNSVRRASNEAVSHVEGGTLPPRSTLDSMNGFRVCSPELCFVQMATLWNLPKLIELGFELCGAYDLSDNSYRTCAPLTSVEKLTAYANSLDKTHGKRKAIKALRVWWRTDRPHRARRS